jgi:glutamyl-tRNA reductase
VANRTKDHAERLVATVRGTTAELQDLGTALTVADLVISCTGATGLVITADMVRRALRARAAAGGADRPLVFLDLALPRDVDADAADLPGVSVIGLQSLQDTGVGLTASHAEDVAAVRAIVTDELAARVSARHAARVAPTVVALRAKAGRQAW